MPTRNHHLPHRTVDRHRRPTADHHRQRTRRPVRHQNPLASTPIQRCLAYVQRVVRRHTTSRPRTPARKTLYRLALKLTAIRDLDQAAAWITRLHDVGTVYADYLNEKTAADPRTTPGRRNWTWTHARVRKAYNSLLTVYRLCSVNFSSARRTPKNRHC
ncbi:hypothetical protein ACYB2S_14835, partial [Corynebacterium variabile]